MPNEGTFHAHQVPITDPRTNPAHLAQVEEWLRSYRPQELFDAEGRLHADLQALAPVGDRRMGANPAANGGALLRDLKLPDFAEYAVDVAKPGIGGIGATHVLGRYLRDVAAKNAPQRNFRIFGPDETKSNGLEAVFETTRRQWQAATDPDDEFLAPALRHHRNREPVDELFGTDWNSAAYEALSAAARDEPWFCPLKPVYKLNAA